LPLHALFLDFQWQKQSVSFYPNNFSNSFSLITFVP
jgi:hypothetical protein